jgi:integrase
MQDLRQLGHELSGQLAPCTVRIIFSALVMAFKAMAPKADRSSLNKIVSRLSQTANSVRDITGNLLSPKELVAIGIAMMDEAETQTRYADRRASLYRDGLLTMFMALCPLRPGSVGEMRIGYNVTIEEDNVSVRLPPFERKKRRLEDVPLPRELALRFLRYISYYRGLFPTPQPEHADALWLSRNGPPLDGDGISKRIKERMGRRTGKRFTAHMFRHACATYIVDLVPEQARMVVGALGHSGFRTCHRHYIKGQQHTAVRKFQGAVSDLARRGQCSSHRKSNRRRPSG